MTGVGFLKAEILFAELRAMGVECSYEIQPTTRGIVSAEAKVAEGKERAVSAAGGKDLSYPKALTATEAGYIINFRDADTLRNRAAKAIEERRQRLLSKGILSPETEKVTSQHSTTEKPIGAVPLPTLDDVKAIFKGQEVAQLKDGSIAIKTQGGHQLVIRGVGDRP